MILIFICIYSLKSLGGYKENPSLSGLEIVAYFSRKLANDLNGYKKKNKLDLPGLNPEVVGEWIKS